MGLTFYKFKKIIIKLRAYCKLSFIKLSQKAQKYLGLHQMSSHGIDKSSNY